MSTFEIVKICIMLFGGLALFLYGMTSLGNSLERLSSGQMEKILEKMTNNIFKGVLLGALVTAIIQSSSATTVIVVGLVNAGVLKLKSAVGIIMGANIGTTITGQILRIGDLSGSDDVGNIMSLFSTSTLAPALAIIGLIFYMLCKNDKLKTVGEIFIGLSLIFTGMIGLTDAVSPLSELQAFQDVFASLQNPFLGILAGTLVTILVQSSSASVGILQAVSTTGVLTFSAAFPIIMGQNIGTCSTSMISSIGAKKNAKRASMVHLYFNIIGTVLFLSVFYLLQYTVGFDFWDKIMNMGDIANFHTFFNVMVTIFFLPFHGILVKLAEITVKDIEDSDEIEANADEIALDDRFLKSPSIAIQQSHNAIVYMAKLAKQNFMLSKKLYYAYDAKDAEKIREQENIVDNMEDKLNAYLVKITKCQINEAENETVSSMLHLVSEFERISDYSVNILEGAESLNSKKISFSEEALNEFDVITNAVIEIIDMALDAVTYKNTDIAKGIEPLEETIDIIEDTLKLRHIDRFKKGLCAIDGGVIFLDALTDIERIADHCSNIAVHVINNNDTAYKNNIKRHEYIQKIHKGESTEYREAIEKFSQKYSI